MVSVKGYERRGRNRRVDRAAEGLDWEGRAE
jgi:hypothetical protein